MSYTPKGVEMISISAIDLEILTRDEKTKIHNDKEINYKEKIKIRPRGGSTEARFTIFSEQLSLSNPNAEINFNNAKKVLQLETYIIQLESIAEMFENFGIQSNYSINTEVCSKVIEKSVQIFSYITNVLKRVNNKNIEKKNVYKRPLNAYNRIVTTGALFERKRQEIESKNNILVEDKQQQLIEIPNPIRPEIKGKAVKEIINYLKNEDSFGDRKDLNYVKNWFPYWLWNYKKDGVVDNSFNGDVSKTYCHIIKKWGNYKITELNTEILQKWFDWLYDVEDKQKGKIKYSNSTVHKIYLLLNSGIERAIDKKVKHQLEIPLNFKNPCKDLNIREVNPKANRMKHLSLETENKIIEIFKKDFLCLPFALMICFGLRASELVGLQWKDIDFKKRMIYLERSYQRIRKYDFDGEDVKCIGSKLEITTLKSETSYRSIPIREDAYIILQYIYKNNKERFGKVNPDDHVFLNENGDNLTTECMRLRIDRNLNTLGISEEKITSHRFRHTFATRLYKAHVDIRVIQELLGHASPDTTEIYLHVEEEDKTNAIRQTEQYYKENNMLQYAV